MWQYRWGIRMVVASLTLMVGGSAAVAGEAPVGDETSMNGGDKGIVVAGSDGVDTEMLQESVCKRLADALTVSCGDETGDEAELAGDYRYRADIEAVDETEWSLRIASLDRPDIGIVDRQLRLETDEIGRGGLATEIERDLIDGVTDRRPSANHDPMWWRAGGWQAAALTAGTIWYFSYGDLNSVDWDFAGLYSDDPELRPQSEVWKNFGGWRLDDNVMFLNTPLHPMAGAAYYLLGRGHNLGMWSSILLANLTSFFWEAGIEHHEVISLNDMILTGIGGIPLGEFYHQFGQFFRSAEPTWYNQAMAWVFAAPSQINDLIDGTGPLYVGARDDRGWPEATWHRFEIRPGFSAAGVVGDQRTRFDGEITASAELVRLPDFRRTGERNEWLTGPLRSKLETGIAAGGGDIYSWGLRGELDFAGYYRHRVADGVGTSFFAGAGLAFDHQQHRYDGGLDRYGLVHLPGLRLDGSWLTGPADVRVRYGVHPDFASIDSVAYPVYRDETGRRAGRTVLDDERYYMGWGLTNMLGIEVEASPAHLHWDARVHWARGWNALDRFWDDEERFGQDLDGYLTVTDTVWHHEVGALFDTPVSSLQTGVVGEYRSRAGTVEDGEETWSDRRRDLRGLGVVRMGF